MARDTFMFVLDSEEVEEMRMAMKARARMNGIHTRAHKVCTNILQKIDESESNPHAAPNGTPNGKSAGVDSTKFKEY